MTQPESAQQPKANSPSQVELEAEIARTRAEVASTLEALSGRLDPRVRVNEATEEARQAATDMVALVKGNGLPQEDPRRTRNVRLAVGAAVVAAVAVTAVVVSAIRSRRH